MFAAGSDDYLTPDVDDVTISNQEWCAHLKKMAELEQENAYFKHLLKSGEDVVVPAMKLNSTLGAVLQLRMMLEYLERKIYRSSVPDHVHYYEAFESRKYRWNMILTRRSSHPHAKIIKNILKQKIQESEKLMCSNLLNSFCTLVSVICTAFSNIEYPFSDECQQTYSAETVMSSLTEFGIINVEDYCWVKDIVHTITGFQCFKSSIVEVNQEPAQTFTSASAASSSFASSSRDTS